MCTNIKPLLGRYRYPLYVKCGHCPSCLQSKAIKCSNKIKSNYPYDGHPLILFCTLTYDNRHVPYISGDDLLAGVLERHSRLSTFERQKDVGTLFKSIPIYRDCRTDFLDHGRKRVIRKRYILDRVNVSLDQFTDVVPAVYRSSKFRSQYFLTPYFDFKKLQSNGHSVKRPLFGVPYYKDFQDFMKRLRINLKRKYNYDFPLQYFCCTEYGPRTHRPHLHFLLYCPHRSLKEWQSSIAKAWPYARHNQTKQQVQVAIDAASYVASYVSSSASLPTLFQKSFPPEHHHSKGFGFGRKEFSFESVLSAFRARNLRYDCKRVVGNAIVDVPVLLPQYVLRRYVPKIKGFGCLTSDEIVSLYSGLQPVRAFSKICHLTESDVRTWSICLRNKRKLAASHGLSFLDYGIFASSLWTIYQSNLLIDFYANQSDPFEEYDNISYYMDGEVSSPTLDSLLCNYAPTHYFESDPNKFKSNLISSARLEHLFHVYDKTRKFSNIIHRINI